MSSAASAPGLESGSMQKPDVQLPAVSGAAALGREIDRFPRITGPGRKRCTCLQSG